MAALLALASFVALHACAAGRAAHAPRRKLSDHPAQGTLPRASEAPSGLHLALAPSDVGSPGSPWAFADLTASQAAATLANETALFPRAGDRFASAAPDSPDTPGTPSADRLSASLAERCLAGAVARLPVVIDPSRGGALVARASFDASDCLSRAWNDALSAEDAFDASRLVASLEGRADIRLACEGIDFSKRREKTWGELWTAAGTLLPVESSAAAPSSPTPVSAPLSSLLEIPLGLCGKARRVEWSVAVSSSRFLLRQRLPEGISLPTTSDSGASPMPQEDILEARASFVMARTARSAADVAARLDALPCVFRGTGSKLVLTSSSRGDASTCAVARVEIRPTARTRGQPDPREARAHRLVLAFRGLEASTAVPPASGASVPYVAGRADVILNAWKGRVTFLTPPALPTWRLVRGNRVVEGVLDENGQRGNEAGGEW